MTKTKSSAPPSAGGNAAPTDQPTFRTNPEVDAKIDTYIKDNPKYWAYVQAMPRERLERTVVLNEVRELDRQHRMREGLMKRIDSNPALKHAYETLVKDLPDDQKEGVIAQIGRQARRAGSEFAWKTTVFQKTPSRSNVGWPRFSWPTSPITAL